MKKCLKCSKDVEDMRRRCPHCGGEEFMASGDVGNHYEVPCKCGTRLPFDRDTREIKCPVCKSKIAIRYLGHNDSIRAIVENAGWEFVKSIFAFGHNMIWGEFGIAKRIKKKFEEFQKFTSGIYSTHLSPKAKILEANKRVHFIYFFENKYDIKLGPYDITTECGFAEYLFNCITIQTNDFAFVPMPADSDISATWGCYDCPAAFEITINKSATYYGLHFATKLHTESKGNVTIVRPTDLSLEFFLLIEITDASGKEIQWQLVSGQLVPIKPSEETRYIFNKKTLTMIREGLGDEVLNKLNSLFEAKRKFGGRNGMPSCRQTEIESELQVLGLWNYRDRLFEILKKQGCFVVTACMGNENHPYVVILRQFRDQVLSTSPTGRQFIKLYSLVGPYVANLIGRSNTLRKVMIFFVITPVVSVLSRWFFWCQHYRCNQVESPRR